MTVVDWRLFWLCKLWLDVRHVNERQCYLCRFKEGPEWRQKLACKHKTCRCSLCRLHFFFFISTDTRAVLSLFSNLSSVGHSHVGSAFWQWRADNGSLFTYLPRTALFVMSPIHGMGTDGSTHSLFSQLSKASLTDRTRSWVKTALCRLFI